MHVDPFRLLVLCTVAEAGGVLAAGQRLHLAPSGVSQHLAALERETGLSLVDRSRRGGQRPLQLTAAGRRLAEHGARLADVVAHAEADVLTLTGAVQGPVVVSAFTTVLPRLLLPAIGALARDHPAVRPQIVELDAPAAAAALHAGQVDVMIVDVDSLGPQPVTRGRRVRRLLDDPFRLAVPADWPVPTAVSDLAARPWVAGPPGSAVARALDRLRSGTGLELPGTHSCLEYSAVLSLVDAGLGAGLVPDLAVTETLPHHVRVVDLPGLGSRTINAVHLDTRRVRPVVQALLDALVDAARRRG